MLYDFIFMAAPKLIGRVFLFVVLGDFLLNFRLAVVFQIYH